MCACCELWLLVLCQVLESLLWLPCMIFSIDLLISSWLKWSGKKNAEIMVTDVLFNLTDNSPTIETQKYLTFTDLNLKTTQASH